MKHRSLIICVLTIALLLPVLSLAQVDEFGKPDTLYADLARIDKTNWKIEISMTNDQFVEALSVPFKLSAGEIRIVGDSAIYTGGRIEDFDFKGFRADTAVQCVTMGMMANLGPSKHTLPPGSGRLVTVFVSSVEGKPIEKLSVDTTTTHPNNSLLVMARRVQPGDPPDTIPLERFSELQIVPVFVVRGPK